MWEGIKEGSTWSDSASPDPHSPWSFRLIIVLSIPAYLALVWVITAWLPDCSFLALIPAALAIHSAALLVSKGKE